MPPSALSSPTRAPVALITGAARRIGAVIARTLHAAGFDLVLHYQHSDEAMHALQESLEAERPGSVLTLAADLADPLTPVRLVDAALHRFGQLHALVNNASSFKPTPVGQASQGDWDQLFASNARAPFFLSQAAAPALRIQQGCIVNLVDVYAKRPQVQERLGEQIADTIAASLDARGVLVVLSAHHECVTMRGGRQPDAATVTIAARGELAEPAARAEIIMLLTASAESGG